MKYDKILFLFIALVLSGCNFSEGQRIGNIVKLSQKGFIFRTYEGELATLAKGSTGTMVSNTFLFSVSDDKMVDRISQAMDSGDRVSLYYEEEFFVFPWEGDTKYFVTDVKVIKTSE